MQRPLNPHDLSNGKRQSGYDHVGYSVPRDGSAPRPFQGVKYGGDRDRAGTSWLGPRRATAVEAAQDYCDYVNGNPTKRRSRKRKSAGHKGVRVRLSPVDPEEAHALGVLRDKRGQREGRQGYVYCIGQEPHRLDHFNTAAVKVGYSTNPQARVAELQTGNPRVLKLLGFYPGTEADEQALHSKYHTLNILQEWFQPTSALMAEFGLYADGSTKGA